MRNREAVTKIQARKPFRGSNFRGEAGPATGSGRLGSMMEHEGLWEAEYVVYSYATPIAWYSEGQWYSTTRTFSPTTSRHQSVVRMAVITREV